MIFQTLENKMFYKASYHNMKKKHFISLQSKFFEK